MFAAVFDLRRRPLETAASDGALHIERRGSAGHVLLLHGRRVPVGSEACEAASFEGRCRLVGRVRLDARAELCDRLALPDRDVSDAVLCLYAYAAWGERFVEHLAGDFAFILWDDAKERLVCVRDQIGVRSLFHATVGDTCFVSDSLDWIARVPGLRRDLDDCWIADFLVANTCNDFERTVYRDVSRLPPAHLLILSDGPPSLRRYWKLEIGDPLCLSDGEVVERFGELVRRSIGDRLPPGTVGIAMSGGLDSTTLAACAVDVAGDASRVVAECDYFERLMPDEERHFSTLAARHLGIALHHRAVDDLTYDPRWREQPVRFAEPAMEAIAATRLRRAASEMSGKASVWLYGEGPDNALRFDRDPYLKWLRGRRDWLGLATALLRYTSVKGAGGWWKSLRRHTLPERQSPVTSGVPAWLAPALVTRVNLAERIEARSRGPVPPHPWHPRAVASFKDPLWQRLLGDLGADETLAAFEWRHPFLDLRVLEFMLSLPPIPWAWEKHLMRATMRDRLPAAIVSRKKKPLAASPIAQPIRERGLPELLRPGSLAAYVDVSRLPSGEKAQDDLFRVVAVHVLDHWLASSAG